MGRVESKAIVILSGNIPPFHIFLLLSECYAEPDTQPRFRLLFQAPHLGDLVYRHMEHQLSKYITPLEFFKVMGVFT